MNIKPHKDVWEGTTQQNNVRGETGSEKLIHNMSVFRATAQALLFSMLI